MDYFKIFNFLHLGFSEMAAQKDGSSLELTTETVGHAFVNQFYSLLRNTPGLVYKFYENSSTMSRPGPDGTLVTITTMEVSSESL